MSDRDAILGRIRRSLGVGRDDSARRASVADRLAHPPQGVIPARGQLPLEGRIALFRTMAEKAHATTDLVPAAGVPAAVGTYLADKGAKSIRMGADARLAAMAWSATGLTITHGRAHPDDLVSVSHADGGIAETGTVVLGSGPDNPTTLNYLPTVHIVVLRTADLAGDSETAVAAFRVKRGSMPRVMNFITGPSRSADIEQRLLLGAHGPLRLHVVLTTD